MNKTIVFQENFLSKTECEYCINFFDSKVVDSFHYGDNNTTPLDLLNYNEEFDLFNKRVIDLCKSLYNTEYSISNNELVKWYPGRSSMRSHLDFPTDIWSAIIYLNDGYYGGKTFFDNGIQITPKKGSVTLFSGSRIYHGVTPLINGNRYTLAYWISENV
jgi:hypothetical protein